MSSFYCQLDYEHVPYLSPVGVVHGNLANNGCGVCSASMIAENLAGISLPPEECARLAKASGAREGGGTNFFIFAPYLAQHTNLSYHVEWDSEKVLRFLQEKRGMAVANTQGDREADGYIGVFSNSGHYIVLAGVEGNTAKVWDPMYKEGSGRFDSPGRRGKVTLYGTDAYADFSVISQDCLDRPYFLYEKIEEKHKSPLIGVLCAPITQETARMYTRAVVKAGGIPVLLSEDIPTELLEETISRIDALLLTDAPGIAPDSSIEGDAVRICRGQNKPVLGMGRGMQCMALALGGTIEPADRDPDAPQAHPVQIARGTRLEAIAGPGSWPVHSCRRRAVNRLPEGARIAALAPDDAVEAFEMGEGSLFLGVQWCPEQSFEQDARAFSLFQAFIAGAKAKMLDQGEGK